MDAVLNSGNAPVVAGAVFIQFLEEICNRAVPGSIEAGPCKGWIRLEVNNVAVGDAAWKSIKNNGRPAKVKTDF